MLKTKGLSIAGKTVAVSGFGNVAWGAVTKVNQLGGKVVTLSGPDGFVYDPDGIKGEKIQYMIEMRASAKDEVKSYADKFKVQFFPGKRPWSAKVDVALPCATQNELDENNAKELVKSGLEMSQNSMRLPWPKEEVDARLHQIMKSIHDTCMQTAERFGDPGNYVMGANIAGFLKVANAMLEQGLV
jgi:glutamate dehydrogenase (NADP+)